MSDEQTRPDPEEPAEAPLPALDHDDDPDALAGDFTDPDVDVVLEVEHDEDGGDQ